MTNQVPRDRMPESTLALLAEGYGFGLKRFERFGSDAFEARIMGQKALFLRGPDAAEAFYVPGRMTRRGAIPGPALRMVQDKKSVATLDDAAHRRRKEMFLEMMSTLRIEQLSRLAENAWDQWINAADGSGQSWKLHDVAQELMLRAVCEWSGIPVKQGEIARRARDMAVTFDAAGAIDIRRRVKGIAARRRCERWMQQVIAQQRNGRLQAPSTFTGPATAVEVIASHRDLEGELLALDVAGIELLNVIRATVAIARYVTFEALAFIVHPGARDFVRNGGAREAESFVDEVRRFYPFIPAVAGRARESFSWNGIEIPVGKWVFLDVYASHHRDATWGDSAAFRPDRFIGRTPTPFDLIPQGGGAHDTGHRCPGEWITIELMKTSAVALATHLDYTVPPQDLTVSLSRIPAIPRSGIVIEDLVRQESSAPQTLLT